MSLQFYVCREDTGWQLTEAGYAFLAAIDLKTAKALGLKVTTPIYPGAECAASKPKLLARNSKTACRCSRINRRWTG